VLLDHPRIVVAQRIMAAMDFFNQEPVVHTWTCKLDKAA
jgi:hypothetical protein